MQILHPLDFQKAWGLSTKECARILGLASSTSFRRYSCQQDKVTHTTPRLPVQRLAAAQSLLWLKEGRQPQSPGALRFEEIPG